MFHLKTGLVSNNIDNMTHDHVLTGFIKAAKTAGLSEGAAVDLYKQAGPMDMLKMLGKLKPSRGAIDAAGPLVGGLAGAGATVYNNRGYQPAPDPVTHQAQPYVESKNTWGNLPQTIANGVGGAMISSPRRYREILSKAKMQADPVTSAGYGILGDLAKKTAITAVPSVGKAVINVSNKASDLGDAASNIKNTTGNLSNISGQVAKGMEGSSTNISNALKDFTGGVSQVGTNVGAASGDLQKMMQGLSSTSSNLDQASKSLGTGLPAAMGKLPDFMDQTQQGIKDLGQGVNRMGGGMEQLGQAANNIKNPLANIDWTNVAKLGGKDWTRTGVAGGGILTALMLPKLLEAIRGPQQPAKAQKKN